jgi:hypothetical protein
MIDRDIFYARKSICERCPLWKNQCLKGHMLNSPVGCPEGKFPAVDGAGKMVDKPVAAPVAGCKDCQASGDVRPLTWTQALGEFQAAMKGWLAAGRPVVTDAAHNARVSACKKCPGGHYRHHQCKLCKCVVFIKAKLPTETCPANYWPRS